MTLLHLARIDHLQPVADIDDFLRTNGMRHRVVMPVDANDHQLRAMPTALVRQRRIRFPLFQNGITWTCIGK